MPTVDELRNEIRLGVDRFEREVSSGFTKETLAAVVTALGGSVPEGRLPPKADMRADILHRVGRLDEPDPDLASSQFRKGDLQAIADALAGR